MDDDDDGSSVVPKYLLSFLCRCQGAVGTDQLPCYLSLNLRTEEDNTKIVWHSTAPTARNFVL